MRLGKKGQGAMEYLMTYGWAILVVMIVGVVLWQLGVFGGPPGAVNTARGFGKVKVFDPSIKLDPNTDELIFTITNAGGQSINDVVVVAHCDSDDYSTFDTMSPGETQNISCTVAKNAGESFSVDVDVFYNLTVAGTRTSHYETGTIRGSAEPV